MNWPDILALMGSALKAIGWAFLPALLLPMFVLLFHSSSRLRAISDSLVQVIDSLSYRLGETIKWGLVGLVLTVAFSVFALSIFGLSWTKLFESAEYFHACVIMLGSGATLLAGQHVRVDVLHTKMSVHGKALIDFIGFYAFLAPVCLIILWNSQGFTTYAWQIFEGSAEADGIRGEFLLKTLIPLFCVLMIMQGLSIALRAVFVMTGHDEPIRPKGIPPLFETTGSHS